MNSAFGNIFIIFKRELSGHFNSMLAYVFMFIFVALSMLMAFFFGGFIEYQQASLAQSFFFWHPWLFMFLGPAVGMRLWSEENRSGTIELLLTMPVAPWHAIVGKFLAAAAVIFMAIVMTFPIVITVGFLGDPDWGPIWTGYLASFLVAISCVAVTCAVSAFTRSLVACLVVSVALCFALTLIGFSRTTEILTDHLGGGVAGFLAGFSVMKHFQEMTRGVVTLQNIVFYLSLIGFCLFITSVVIRTKRS